MIAFSVCKPLILATSSLGLSLITGCVAQPEMSSQSSPPAQAIAATQQVAASNSVPSPADKAIPRYDHIFVIIAENKASRQIIGGPDTPHLTQLAHTYGLATNFYGEVHPSEANYIAMLGGSTFGIHDDDAYYCQPQQSDPYCPNSKQPGYANHTIAATSLMDQLQAKGLTWKGYFESIPTPGSKVVFAPSVMRALYAVKHNGFMNFKSVQDDPQRAQKIVGLDQLAIDLKAGKAPNYSHIVLNQCHEMHGLPECSDWHQLLKTGDNQINSLVNQITQSPLWKAPGNSAIVLTWDEDDNPPTKTGTQGCCGFDPNSAANFGGGQIATVVITNHGPRGVVDPTPHNHYSLLRTTEDAFGIYAYLNAAGATSKGVQPMTALFALPH